MTKCLHCPPTTPRCRDGVEGHRARSPPRSGAGGCGALWVPHEWGWPGWEPGVGGWVLTMLLVVAETCRCFWRRGWGATKWQLLTYLPTLELIFFFFLSFHKTFQSNKACSLFYEPASAALFFQLFLGCKAGSGQRVPARGRGTALDCVPSSWIGYPSLARWTPQLSPTCPQVVPGPQQGPVPQGLDQAHLLSAKNNPVVWGRGARCWCCPISTAGGWPLPSDIAAETYITQCHPTSREHHPYITCTSPVQDSAPPAHHSVSPSRSMRGAQLPQSGLGTRSKDRW